MRWFLLWLALMIGSTYSQETSYNEAITQKNQKTEQQNSEAKNESAFFEKMKTEKVKADSYKAGSDRGEKLDLERQLVEYTRQLAVFTKWLVAVTAILCFITGGLVWMAFRQEKMAKTHERAYVHVKISDNPDFSRKRTMINDKLAAYTVRIGVKNNGRTPASIKIVRWTLCLEKELQPGKPIYHDNMVQYIELTPELDWATKAEVSYKCDTAEPQALFAEIVYEDIFRKSRYHRMLLRVTREGDTFKHDPIYEGFPEYWKWT